MRDLKLYLVVSRDEAVRYSCEHRLGQRVTTASVESTINRLVNRRLKKRQQMSLSQVGAHYVLQVRCALLNGQLGNILARWYRRFGGRAVQPAAG